MTQAPSKIVVITKFICAMIVSGGSVLIAEGSPITLQKFSMCAVPFVVAIANSVVNFIDRSFAQYQHEQSQKEE